MSLSEKSKSSTKPAWSWTGVEKLDLSSAGTDFRDVIAQLPNKKSSDDQIIANLGDLRAHFQRWLHQDEFGPSRRQQAAALRSLTKSLQDFQRQFVTLSSLVKKWLDAAPQIRKTPSDTVLQALYEATTDALNGLRNDRESGSRDIAQASKLRDCVEILIAQVQSLDTNTEIAIFNISLKRRFDLAQVTGSVFSLTVAETWLNQFWNVVQDTLTELNERGGAQERVSLKLLVERLCKVWEHETGMQVTAHGQVKDQYTGKPETAAGGFVIAAVEAMLPPQAWFEDRTNFGHSVRATTFLPDHQIDRARQALGIMRNFVNRRTK